MTSRIADLMPFRDGAPRRQRVLRGLTIPALLALAAPALQFAPTPAHAATAWFVAPGGNNANTCTSLATACATISAAVGKAGSGDIIQVAASGATPAAAMSGAYLDNIVIPEN